MSTVIAHRKFKNGFWLQDDASDKYKGLFQRAVYQTINGRADLVWRCWSCEDDFEYQYNSTIAQINEHGAEATA